MLWTDGVFISVADLMRVDSEVETVSDSETIPLTGEYGALRAGIEEASMELQKMLVRFGGYIGSGDLSSNHLAAVLNVGLGSRVTQKALLQQVVVSGPSEASISHVKQWAMFWTLQIFYRNAFNRTVKDRYEGKMRYYKAELQRRITPGMWGLGLPIVVSPLSAPGALFERDSGTWDSDNVSAVAGSGTLDASVDVVVTYADMSSPLRYIDADHKGNAESSGSARVAQALTTGNVLHVDITSLNPQTGSQHPSQLILCAVPQLRATHWNVYVGTVGGTLYLQNSTPIQISTKTYELAGNPTSNLAKLGLGQYEDRRFSLVPTRQRA